jgi:hypothetical protein
MPRKSKQCILIIKAYSNFMKNKNLLIICGTVIAVSAILAFNLKGISADETTSTLSILDQNPDQIDTADAVAYVKALATQHQQEVAQQQQQAETEEHAKETARQNIINEAKSKGYEGDGSKEDFEKIFARPELFGENWKRNADVLWESAENKTDIFIQYYQMYK